MRHPGESNNTENLILAAQIFRDLMAAADAARIPHHQASVAANLIAQQHTGVDLLAELRIPTTHRADHSRPALLRTIDAAWAKKIKSTISRRGVNGISAMTLAGLFPIDGCTKNATAMRVAALLRDMGWTRRRARISGISAQYWFRPAHVISSNTNPELHK